MYCHCNFWKVILSIFYHKVKVSSKLLWVSFLSMWTSLKMLDISASSNVYSSLLVFLKRGSTVFIILFPLSSLYLCQNCWLSFAEFTGFPQLLETPQITSIFIFLLESPRKTCKSMISSSNLLDFFFKVHNIFPWYLVSGSIKFKTLIVHVYSLLNFCNDLTLVF